MTEVPARSHIDALGDHAAERVLQAVVERLIEQTGGLVVENEEEAREVIAAAVRAYTDEPLGEDAVAPPTADPIRLVRATLRMLANDADTADLVLDTERNLPEETQMFVEPVSAALALAGIVAFLQTKFSLRVRRVNGKTQVDLSVSKEPTSDELITKVISAAGRASTGE